MAWTVRFSNKAEKALKKLDKSAVERILRFMKERVEPNPKTVGKYLKGNLSDFWRYRVGDYRLICTIEEDELIVLVVEIGHRKEVYKKK